MRNTTLYLENKKQKFISIEHKSLKLSQITRYYGNMVQNEAQSGKKACGYIFLQFVTKENIGSKILS
jgi:hypothetical protein